MALVLIADDDPIQRRHLEKMVNALGHRAVHASDGDEVLHVLRGVNGGDVKAVLLDLVMPNLDGMGALAAMRAERLMRPTVALIAPHSVDQVSSAMRAGAMDFCVKPARSERVQVALASALERSTLAQCARYTGRAVTLRLDDLCAGPAMERAMRAAWRAAKNRDLALLEGEEGTGKTTLARAIHNSGGGKETAFRTLNAAALSSADDLRARLTQLSVDTTLYLRGVQALGDGAQLALLDMLNAEPGLPRLLVGADGDMLTRVRAGQFREDLYYRLSVTPISLPPLRKRADDITALCAMLLARLVLEEGRGPAPHLGDDVLHLLHKQAWPGNLRQLESVLLRALHLCDGAQLDISHFPSLVTTAEATSAEHNPAGPQTHFGLLPMLEDDGAVCRLEVMEERLIRFALAQHEGRMSAVARALGIGRSTLYRKLEAMEIDPTAPNAFKTTGRAVD